MLIVQTTQLSSDIGFAQAGSCANSFVKYVLAHRQVGTFTLQHIAKRTCLHVKAQQACEVPGLVHGEYRRSTRTRLCLII